MRSVLACLALAAAACSGADPDPDGPIPIDSLCDVLVADVCRALIECYGADYRDPEHCREDSICLGGADFRAEVEMGWTTYDPEAAFACHARFESDPCGFGLLLIPSVDAILARCGGVAAGNQPTGAACNSDLDCAEGYCAHVAGVCAGRRCQEWVTEGLACDAMGFNDCDPSLVCRGGVCQRRFAPGDACDDTNRNDCFNDGSWCDLSAGLCREPLTAGERCMEFDGPHCAQGFECISPELFGEGICAEPSGEGGPCGASTRDCEPPLHCVRPPDALGNCQPPGVLGEPCAVDGDCESDLRCAEGECASRLTAGEACEEFRDGCAQGLVCEGGTCQSVHYPGDSCSAGEACIESICTDGVCRARAPLGAACATDDECASRTCDGSVCADPLACL